MTENPIVFLLFVGLNAGLYTTGVILIREAVIRWNKGWASIFLLALAYGIVEEGLALQTLFNPLAQPVGELGFYGHWLGVSWVWSVGVLMFHIAYSISLPILLFGLAFPALKGKSLVSPKRQKICLLILFLDCLVLFGIVKYWPGWEIMIGSSLAVAGLILLAKRVPKDLLKSTVTLPKSPRRLAIIGGLFFPAFFLGEAIMAGAKIPPLATLGAIFAMGAVTLIGLRRSIGSTDNTRQKIMLSLGMILPVAVFGVIANFARGGFLVLVEDATILLFIRHLWKRQTILGLQIPAFQVQPTVPIETPSPAGFGPQTS